MAQGDNNKDVEVLLSKYSVTGNDLGDLDAIAQHAEQVAERVETVPAKVVPFYIRLVTPRTQKGISFMRTSISSIIAASGVLRDESLVSVKQAVGEIVGNAGIYGTGDDIKAFVEIGSDYVTVGVTNKTTSGLPVRYPNGSYKPIIHNHGTGYTRGRGLKLAIILMDDVRVYCDSQHVGVLMTKYSTTPADSGRTTDDVKPEEEIVASVVPSIFISEVSPYKYETGIQELYAELNRENSVVYKLRQWLANLFTGLCNKLKG